MVWGVGSVGSLMWLMVCIVICCVSRGYVFWRNVVFLWVGILSLFFVLRSVWIGLLIVVLVSVILSWDLCCMILYMLL